MRLTFFLILLAVLVSAAGPVFAEPSLKLTAPPKEATTDLNFVYEVRLEWPTAEGVYEVLPADPVLENLSVISQNLSQETSDRTTSSVLRFILRGTAKGVAKIGAIDLRYRTAPDAEWRSLPVPAQTVLIKPPFPWVLIFWGLTGVIGIPAAGYGAWRAVTVLKEMERKKNLPPPDPRQAVYAKAEEAILTFKGESQQETVAHWALQIKKTVLTYYALPVAAVTESEILRQLEARRLPLEEFREVSGIFSTIERLKFMGQTLPVREMETLQKTLLQYVRGKIIIENQKSDEG